MRDAERRNPITYVTHDENGVGIKINHAPLTSRGTHTVG